MMKRIDKINQIINEYENNLVVVFKETIDEAGIKAIEEGKDSIETFIAVCDAKEDVLLDVAISSGFISLNENCYSRDVFKPVSFNLPLSENFYLKVEELMEPYVNAAQLQFEKIGEDIINSNDLGELLDKVARFNKIVDNVYIRDNSYLYDGYEFQKKKTK